MDALVRHVAVVTETYPPEINGVAGTVARLVSGLCDRGRRVSLYHPGVHTATAGQRPGGPAIRHMPSLPIPGYRGLRFGLPARARLARSWVADRPDLVHVATEGPLGATAVALARELELPVVSGFHTNFDRYAGHYGLGALESLVDRYLRWLHNRCDCTLAPTEAMRAQLLARGYRRVAVLGRGVDTTAFHPRRRCEALRRSWGIPERGLACLYVGRLAPEKNVELALDAARQIAGRHAPARMIVVGDGPDRSRLMASHPQALFTGVLTGEELWRQYASADVFLFPSTSETFGNVVLEAMASRLAIVAFDHAAAAAHLRDGVSAALVAPDDPAEFLRRARTVALDPWKLEAMRDAAMRAARGCDWTAVLGQLDDAYRLAVERPALGRTRRGSAAHLAQAAA